MKNIEETGVLVSDEYRAEVRNVLKKIMDDYYKEYINMCLNREIKMDWSTLFDAYELMKKGKMIPKEIEKIQDEKRIELYGILSAYDEFKKMFSAKMITELLPQFISQSTGYNEDEKKQYEEVIHIYSRFTSDFTDFFQNRITIVSRKHDIQKDQIRQFFFQCIFQFFTVCHPSCRKPGRFQCIDQQLSDIFFVFHTIDHSA